MKKLVVVLMMLVVVFSFSSFAACGKKKKKTYTQSENAAYWIKGRDETLNYKGKFTLKRVEENEENGKKYKSVLSESWDGGEKYYHLYNHYGAESGDYVMDDESTYVLQPALNGDIKCGRLFSYGWDEDEEKYIKSARYVSPDYFSYEMLQFTPGELLDDYGVQEGNDLNSLVEDIKAFFAEDGGEEPQTIEFKKNSDGSVSLNIKYIAEGQTDYSDEENYSFKSTGFFSLTVKDGKIIRTTDEIISENFYTDSSKNTYEKTRRDNEITYEFDQKGLDSINTTTDETINAYYVEFNVHVEGCDTSFIYDETLFGGTVTAQALTDDILSHVGKFVRGDSEEGMFDLYADKQMTKPFTSVVTDKDEYDIYLKFSAPEGKAIVVTMVTNIYDDKDAVGLQIAYLWDAGKRFYPRDTLTNYTLLTVDGVKPESYSSFICRDGGVYRVLYDGTYNQTPPKVEHGPLPDWEYNEQAHWHGCNECPDERFNWGLHNLIYKDGKKVCEECGYTQEIPLEENFSDFYNAYKYSVGFKGEGYSYKYYYEDLNYDEDLKTYVKGGSFTEFETCFGNRYLYKWINTIVKDGVEVGSMKTTKALKLVTVDGKSRLKEITIDSSDKSHGTLKSPSVTADSYVRYSPTKYNWFGDFVVNQEVTTYQDFCSALSAAFEGIYQDAMLVSLDKYSIKRNDDGSVSLFFRTYLQLKDEDNSNDDYRYDIYIQHFEMVASGGRIIKIGSENSQTVDYNERKDVYAYNEAWYYGYSFDEEAYNAISDETETTSDEYVSSIQFYINGYSYMYSLSDIKIGSTVTASDAKNHLADVGEGCTKPLFAYSVDPNMFKIYTDKEMTTEFTSLVAEEEKYNLYAKMIVPEGKAIVISVREFGDSRAIDLCYLKDVGSVFKTSILGNTYPLIEADGVQITDNSRPEITCSESRIYVVVCKVR